MKGQLYCDELCFSKYKAFKMKQMLSADKKDEYTVYKKWWLLP